MLHTSISVGFDFRTTGVCLDLPALVKPVIKGILRYRTLGLSHSNTYYKRTALNKDMFSVPKISPIQRFCTAKMPCNTQKCFVCIAATEYILHTFHASKVTQCTSALSYGAWPWCRFGNIWVRMSDVSLRNQQRKYIHNATSCNYSRRQEIAGRWLTIPGSVGDLESKVTHFLAQLSLC